MNDDDWLKGEDGWISEEKVRALHLPGIALPGLRDLKIQFIALIYFDLFLGPVVYINEIQRGSSFISKLRDQRTISEVYAGVADVEVDELSNIDDSIAVFRYVHEKQEHASEVKTILLISCIPGTDLYQVKELGKNALFKAKGDPENIGAELSKYLRGQLSSTKKFRTNKISEKIVILDENRIQKPLQGTHINGLIIVDYNARLADFRNFPSWLYGEEINEFELLNFLDVLSSSISEKKITSFLYKDIILLTTNFKKENLYVIISVEENDIINLRKLNNWLIPYSEQLRSQWKISSPEEIRLSLSILDKAIIRGTIKEDLVRYVNMILKSSKIKPTVLSEIPQIDPILIQKDKWEKVKRLDGSKSLLDIHKSWSIDLIDVVSILEWCRLRDILVYLEV